MNNYLLFCTRNPIHDKKDMSKHKHKNKHKWSGWRLDNWDWNYPPSTLRIEAQAYEKLCYYTQLSKGEVSGLGKIKITKEPTIYKWKSDEIIIVEDVKIFNQTCSYGGTKLKGEQLSNFIVSLIKQKQDPHDWRLWWHTHNDFGVGWSGTDTEAISLLTEEEGAELISICINKDYDIVARRDKNGGRRHEELDVRILPRINMSIYGACEQEIKKKVKERIYKFKNWKYDDYIWAWDKDKNYYKKIKRDIELPLLEYKPKSVKIITDKDARALGLHYEPDTGLFIRISDGKILTEKEIKETGLLDEIRERGKGGLSEATRFG